MGAIGSASRGLPDFACGAWRLRTGQGFWAEAASGNRYGQGTLFANSNTLPCCNSCQARWLWKGVGEAEEDIHSGLGIALPPLWNLELSNVWFLRLSDLNFHSFLKNNNNNFLIPRMLITADSGSHVLNKVSPAWSPRVPFLAPAKCFFLQSG